MKPCNVTSKTATVLLLLRLVRYIVCSEGKSITGSNCTLKFMLLNCTVVFEVVPNGQVLVCPGRQFLITCSSNNSMFLQWNVPIPYYNVTNTRVISAFNNVGHVTPLQVPSVVITFTIPSTSPLTSELSVNSATVNLNGTKFECTERDTEMDRSNETWLHVINIAQGIML